MWFAFWMWIASSVVSALLAPTPPGAKDSAAWTKPTAEEGRSVPIVLGTVCLRSLNCLSWTETVTKAIKQRVGGFLGIGAKRVNAGFKYYVGAMLGMSTTIDAFEDIYVGGKSLKAAGIDFPWEFAATGATKTIHLDGLFGGAKGEGGLDGTLGIYFGSDTQTGDSYLTTKWGSPAPGFRGMAYIVLRNMYIGTVKYLKDWQPVVRHCPCPSTMDPAKANISGSANPAHGIAYVMTADSDHGGLGLSESRFNWASFNSAATVFYDEGFGISLSIDGEKDADVALGEILKTVDATLFTDPITGLWTLKPIRADYVLDDLPEFKESDVIGKIEFTRPTWPETLNRVVVRFLSREEDFTIRTVQDRDPANRAIQGVERCATMDFLAIPDKNLAQKVAARERHQHAYPVAGLRLTLKRKAWSLRPGSPFLFSWGPLGISKMVCRVSSIRYGALEAGQIAVEAVEDVFGVTSTAFSPPPSSGWVNPIADPVALIAQRLVEAPYAMVGAERNVLAMGVRGDQTTESLDVWADEGNGYLEVNRVDPTPSGLLTAAWSAKTPALDTVGFTLLGTDLDDLVEASTNADGRNRGVNLGLVGNEIFSWTICTANTDGSYAVTGILRGVMDTVPEDHPSGERVWFLSQGCALTQVSAGGGGGSVGADGLSITWRMEYSATTAYNKNDAISKDGSSYICLQACTNQAPSTATTYWGVLSQAGRDGTGTLDKVRVYLATATNSGTGGWQKVPMDTVAYDTGSIWNATNKRVIPKSAGYYLVNMRVRRSTAAGLVAGVGVNGSSVRQVGTDAGSVFASGGSALVYCNGTADYIEAYAWTNTAYAYTNLAGDTWLEVIGPF